MFPNRFSTRAYAPERKPANERWETEETRGERPRTDDAEILSDRPEIAGPLHVASSLDAFSSLLSQSLALLDRSRSIRLTGVF